MGAIVVILSLKTLYTSFQRAETLVLGLVSNKHHKNDLDEKS